MGGGTSMPDNIDELKARELAGDQFDPVAFASAAAAANASGTVTKEEALAWAKALERTPYAVESCANGKNAEFDVTTPRCANNHAMVLSDYEGMANGQNYANGYCCDYCGMSSAQGICGGKKTRWFCKDCGADICFDCYPCIPRCSKNHVMVLSAAPYPEAPDFGWGCDLCGQNPKDPGHVGPMLRWHCSECKSDYCIDDRPTPRRKGKPTCANDLAALVRTSTTPPHGITPAEHRTIGTWCMMGNPVVMSLDAVGHRMCYLALKHKVLSQQQLQQCMLFGGGAMNMMLFFIAYAAKDVLIKWCLAFLHNFAENEASVKHLLPVFKFILADPNFASFGLGSHTKGLPNPNFAVLGLEPNTTFLPLCHAICDTELNAIAEAGEKMCEENGFCGTLKDVGKELQDVHGIRLDGVVGNRDMWLALESQMNTKRCLAMGFDAGTEFCYFLELLNKITESTFHDIVHPIATTNGQWKLAPPKNAMRMVGKLHLDHKDEEAPQSCANIDGVRGGATFAKTEDLMQAFQSLSDRADIRYLRVKNGFASEKGNYGYRAVLVNMEFTKEGMTWGSLLRAPETQQVIQKYVAARCEGQEYSREFWDGVVEQATQNETLNELPFSYIGEVQFLTDEYMAMRKKSHLWYKIKRQTFPYDLMNDLNKFHLIVKTRYKEGKSALKEVPKE